MLKVALVCMIVSWTLQYLIILLNVRRYKRTRRLTVLRWSWRDVLGHAVYYGGMIWVVVAVLNGARP